MSLLAAIALGAAPLTCGAAAMPGVAEQGEDGVWRGSAVDSCRRIAAATGREMTFRLHDRPENAVAEDVAFVSDAELAAAGGRLLSGPPPATARHVLVARADGSATRPGDLSNRMICFIVGTRAETALNHWAQASGWPIERLAFQEPIEMRDGYQVYKCAALAVDAAELPTGLGDRIVTTLAETSIRVVTPTVRGSEWHRQVLAAINSP